ncbi:MAG TPA: carboxypeptidase-like regulatory domain-containing protein [Cyclobacteriaceae bacterium]|nr:carboxypeptidase-like regulatory domain-containing protein [Cyclobacteriaceae bacterium]
MRLYFLLILLKLSAIQAFTQPEDCQYRLRGYVRDGQQGALAGASVIISSIQKAASADAHGYFVLDNLCAGKYELTFSFIGYKNQSIEVIIPAEMVIEVILEEDAFYLEDIKVEALALASPVQSTALLSEREFDLVKGKSLGESLRRLPGISTLQTGPAIFKPVIHGLHSQRILILNNGIRQEGQQWGPEHAPEIDPFIANEITVIKGAEAVRYGADAMGGVILIDTPPLHQSKGLGGELNLMGMNNSRMGVVSGMLEGDFAGSEKWGWRLQSTYKKGGDFKAARYYLSNTGLEEVNFSAALGYKTDAQGFELYLSSFNAEIGILRSAHAGSLTDLNNGINNDTPWFVRDFSYDIDNPKQKIGHHLLKLNAFKNFGERRLDFQYGIQLNERKEFDVRRGGRSDIPALSLQLITQTLDASVNHQTGFSEGTLGVNLTYKNNINVPGTGIRPLLPNYEQANAGIFLIEHFNRAEWKYELGLRYDYQFLLVRVFDGAGELFKPQFNFNYFSASVGAHRKLLPGAVFNSHLGFSSRPPHVSELYSEGLHHGTASIDEGLMRPNGELLTDQSFIKNEESFKWINTVSVFKKSFGAELSVYANLIDNYIYLRPTTTRLTIRGAFPVFQYSQTKALLAGADLSVNTDLNKNFSFTGKYSYVHGSDLTNNDVLIFLPPAQFENGITYQLPKQGKIYDVFFSLIASSNLRQFRAPQVIPPNEVRDYDGNELFDFAPAPASFTLLNFEQGFKFNVRDKAVSVVFTVENILNESYRVYMNRLRYFADDVGRNFSIKLKYDFHSHD